MAELHTTVVICTWNRARLLDQTLNQMQQLRTPEGIGWELLVVNNNCTDDTDAVLAKYADRLPLRRLFEPEQGKSAACNCAIRAARGELLLWTDDDVLLDPDWLAEYARAAAAWPDADFFGGTIEPWFETDPPRWVRQHLSALLSTYAIRSGVRQGAVITEDYPPYGANMGTRKRVFEAVRFDNTFSRKKDGHVRGEETVLIRQLAERGMTGRWVASARVRHYIPAERLTARYVWDYFFGHGIENARMNPDLLRARTFLGWPLWSHRVYWPAVLQAWLLQPFKTSRWLSSLSWAARARGYAHEYRRALQESSAG